MLALAVMIGSPGALGDDDASGSDADAAAIVRALFGDELKAVGSTRGEADDLALAWQIVRAAHAAKDDPALIAALCTTAYDVAWQLPGGHEPAGRAMDLLAECAAGRALGARRRLVEMWQRRQTLAEGGQKSWATESLIMALLGQVEAEDAANMASEAESTLQQAQELTGKLSGDARQRALAACEKVAAGRDRIAEIAACLSALQRDPADRQARRKLVQLYITAKDDPATAAAYVERVDDEVLATYVQLAARPVGDLRPTTACELGRWYAHLAEQAARASRAAMLRRAARCFDSAIERSGADAEFLLVARAELQSVREALAALEGRSVVADEAHDVLSHVDLRRDGVEGVWSIAKGSVRAAEHSRSRLNLPVMVEGSYELRIKAAKKAGKGGLFVILPAAGRHVTLALDVGNTSGLMQIDGERLAGNNPTVVDGSVLDVGAMTLIEIVVDCRGEEVIVRAALDGRKLVNWSGAGAQLSLPPELAEVPAGRVVIGGVGGGAVFDSVNLIITDGPAHWTR
jgi:hypothetical protein